MAEILFSILLLAVVIGGGFLLHAIIYRFVSQRGAESPGSPDVILQHCRSPLRFLLPLFLLFIFLPALSIPPDILAFVRRLLAFLFVTLFAWLLCCIVLALRDGLLSRYDMNVRDNLKARAVHTQVRVLTRISLVVIVVIASASALMIFDNLRHIGTSILASAGVMGIVIGFAAQKSIATLLAGLQLALTQPIRIDDVLIVEGEWGRVEEITLTYVVIRIWDLRRLVVPTGYFLEKPFQNWTRVSADLLGTVMLYADYRVPIGDLREELHRILRESTRWDGKVWNLQVTNLTEQTVELRAMMSAQDASTAWDLRCEVRERILDYLATRYPEYLPKVRAELRGNGEES